MTGLPVIRNGKRIGRAACVELTEDLTRMRGLYVDCGLRGGRYIPEQSISVMGEVSILADERGKRASAKNSALLRRALSTDGQLLGAVSNAMIDEATRTVEALELSRGFIDDLFLGRRWIRQFTVNRDSGDVIFPGSGQARPRPKGGGIL